VVPYKFMHSIHKVYVPFPCKARSRVSVVPFLFVFFLKINHFYFLIFFLKKKKQDQVWLLIRI